MRHMRSLRFVAALASCVMFGSALAQAAEPARTADIAKRGYKLAGISYETPEKQAAFIERRGIKYDLLCDPGSVVIDRWSMSCRVFWKSEFLNSSVMMPASWKRHS